MYKKNKRNPSGKEEVKVFVDDMLLNVKKKKNSKNTTHTNAHIHAELELKKLSNIT